MTIGRPDNPQRRLAFTLLELILVMVLISVLLGVAAPSLRGFHGARRSADAAAQLLCLANYASSQAIAHGAVHRLNVDASDGAYWLTAQVGGAYVELTSEYGRRFVLPETMSIAIELPAETGQVSYVQFYPSGRSDEATIRLISLRGRVLEVTSPSATEPFRIVSSSEAGDS